MPRYSDAALSARDVFFSSVASIHFFVEDERLENLYEVILSRVFPRIAAFEVFPLAGKNSVLGHLTAAYPKPKQITRIYILDKDFDDVLGLTEVHDGLFYLDQYCIENVVLDEDSLLRLCVQERPRVRKGDLRRRLNYRHTIDSWMPLLDDLHRAFALVQKHGLGLQNTDSPPEVFSLAHDRSVLCPAKVRTYIELVCDLLVSRGIIASPEQYPELSRKIFGSGRKSLRRINGKFLARLHYHRLKRDDLSGNINQDSFVIRCAQGSNLAGLRNFARRVRAYIGTGATA